MTFASDTVACNIDADGTYTLTAPLVYEGRDQTFTVPSGFVTDLASVPRALSALVPIGGRWDRAAIVHDWLCTSLDEEHRAGVRLLVAEKHRESMRRLAIALAPANPVDTDGIFRRILRELGTPVVLRWLFWCGVRWGAVANPARRAGWLRTFPAVLGISLVALPFVAPVAVVTALALAVGGVLEVVANALSRPRTDATGTPGVSGPRTGSDTHRTAEGER